MASLAGSTTGAIARKLVVEVHSHLFPAKYIELLKNRTEIPYIRIFPLLNNLCLRNRPPQNTSSPSRDGTSPKLPPGRTLHLHYYDMPEKIAFMDHHGIEVSVISLGNPWLGFLPSDTARAIAVEINDAAKSVAQIHQDYSSSETCH
ncbi:hypothetical protein GQ53DRAFT_856370 [Thozetella sp. PMI_491]|nr:hypothetical protein GQ53DRAFT_856370 [Thozetella sp. PMI_491]